MARYTKPSKASDDPFEGEPVSKGLTSGNSRETLGDSALDNSRSVGESRRGSKAPADSGSGAWSMESVPQNYRGNNTQKSSGKEGRRPELDSEGDVNGVTTSNGGTSSMRGMRGSRSGGSHGDFHKKRSRM